MVIIDKYILNKFNEQRLPRQKLLWQMFADARLLLIVLFLLPGLFLLIIGHWQWLLIMIISGAASITFGYILKTLILRPRPNNYVTYLGRFDSSFPSLHALCAFNLAYLLSLFIPELSLAWFLIASLIGIARMYIQVHYFTDVCGGIIFGIGIAHLTLILL